MRRRCARARQDMIDEAMVELWAPITPTPENVVPQQITESVVPQQITESVVPQQVGEGAVPQQVDRSDGAQQVHKNEARGMSSHNDMRESEAQGMNSRNDMRENVVWGMSSHDDMHAQPQTHQQPPPLTQRKASPLSSSGSWSARNTVRPGA